MPITQWAKGEYLNANNKSDALQLMVSNGLQYRTDDYGNDTATASALPILNNTISIHGSLEKTTDVDYFTFNASAGTLNLNVFPVTYAPDADIELRVFDSAGNQIAINNPKAQFASTTLTLTAGTYYLSVRPAGYGDPLSTGYSNYGSLGQYYITGSVSSSMNNAPTAAAGATPMSGAAPLAVLFSSAGSSDPEGTTLSYLWEFGDNTSSTLADPSKTYSTPGTYTATLTVKDAAGFTGSKSVVINATNQSPISSFTVQIASNNIPLTANLDGSASSDPDGQITGYAWDFGDGTTATGATATHTYTTAGAYTAKLTVKDSFGATGSRTYSISAIDPAALAAPSGLVATTNGKNKGQVVLNWQDNSPNETGFYIERSGANGVPIYSRVGTASSSMTTFTDPVPSDSYYYRVQAYSDSPAKTSGYSNSVQIRVR